MFKQPVVYMDIGLIYLHLMADIVYKKLIQRISRMESLLLSMVFGLYVEKILFEMNLHSQKLMQFYY